MKYFVGLTDFVRNIQFISCQKGTDSILSNSTRPVNMHKIAVNLNSVPNANGVTYVFFPFDFFDLV